MDRVTYKCTWFLCGKVDNTMCIYKMKHSLVDKYCRENKIALSAG